MPGRLNADVFTAETDRQRRTQTVVATRRFTWMGNDATAARYSICRHWLCDVCQRLADAGTGAYVFPTDTESQNDRALTFTALQTIKHPANSGRVSAFFDHFKINELVPSASRLYNLK